MAHETDLDQLAEALQLHSESRMYYLGCLCFGVVRFGLDSPDQWLYFVSGGNGK